MDASIKATLMAEPIRASLNDSSGHYTLNTPNAPVFKKIIGAIGWADPHHEDTTHALLVGGETTDSRYVIMDEFMGSYYELVKECISAKDRLLLSELWLDIRERDLPIQLSREDGLTRYISLGLDLFEREIWKTESTTWPHFRNRETTVQLYAVPQLLFSSSLKGMDRVVKAISKKTMSLRPSCIQSAWVLEQHNAGDVLSHPVTKALCYLTYALKEGGEVEEKDRGEAPFIYPDLKK